ncbi:class I SAM-dependent methyltransferase [Hymenobacter sp. CRA2]|uniref:class I SAM-dependent methyltransferase n=1 Tax=Hymenobacter sp. CRA2 TaxID=1955620 RepID=UPI00098E9C90|nr:class I SAM-dependent methyltransferase [Hymenobacter sp. CRA2]OON68876.1 hypothetical protein B0919_11940 [Hymenobacter sp. CRA2]
MIPAHITAILDAWAAQPALLREANFAYRAEVLEELEVHVLDRLDDLLAARPSPALSQLRSRALALQARLEAADQQLFARFRADIRAGRCRQDRLRALLMAYAAPAATSPGTAATSYDSLDTLTNGLFIEPTQPLEAQDREPEMVYYQKTPARIILELAARLAPSDVFYDLGSGLGQVPLLVHLLSGARARGIEIEPAYCRYAQACAGALNLPEVQFRCADARTADYADGTAFYLFTPFTGSIMAQVLARLRQLAQRRPLRLFSYGPSTGALEQQAWLRRPEAGERHLYQLAEFHSG